MLASRPATVTLWGLVMAGRCTANLQGAPVPEPEFLASTPVCGMMPPPAGNVNILNKNLLGMDGGAGAKRGNWTMRWFLMKPSIFHQAPGTVRNKLIPLQGAPQMRWRTFTGPWRSNYFFNIKRHTGDLIGHKCDPNVPHRNATYFLRHPIMMSLWYNYPRVVIRVHATVLSLLCLLQLFLCHVRLDIEGGRN